MKTNTILVRFSEVFLKGGRRQWFMARLRQALERQVMAAGPYRVRESHDLLEVVHKDARGQDLPEFEVGPELALGLSRVFGAVNWSPALRTAREINILEDLVARIGDEHVAGRASFRVEASRQDKDYPLNSMDLNRRLGAIIWQRTQVPGKMKDPEVTVHCHILRNGAALYVDVVKGPGGLPVGSSGRVTLLLSGGIDSPVAGYQVMRRGCELDAVHFDAQPYTTAAARKKVETLAGMLAAYEPSLKLHVVPFAATQARLRDGAPGRLLVVLYRRMMMRIATRIARAGGSLALVTGENLGQVASQTLENLGVIQAATDLPVLRPLLTYDKQDTVTLARQIGTFATSVLPHEDCCSLFVPPHPETAAKLELIQKVEADFDLDAMVAEAVAATEVCSLQSAVCSPGAGR